MAARIFISYRRDDSAAAAGRVNDRLEHEFGRESLFMDVDAIPLGVDFVNVLGAEVAKCDVLLAIIGPNWLDAKDEEGNRRLNNQHDFVLIEIAAALTRNIPVIPILLDGTRVPKAGQLPDELKSLARRNGLDVRHASFRGDMDRLVRALRGTSPPTPSPPKPTSREDQLREEGRIKIDAPIVRGAPDGWFKPGEGKVESFKDHELGPEMVVVPAGEFMMGSSESEIAALKQEYNLGFYDCEGPQRTVRIKAPCAVGRHSITREQFAAFVSATGHTTEGGIFTWKGGKWEIDPKASWQAPGLSQENNQPVVGINWDDAKAYADWLSRKTGKTYRLLSEAEREYVTRAGTTTAFWWGETISTSQANYDGNYSFRGGTKEEYRQKTVPVDSFAPNPWGLYNVHGNVWEWVEDVWHEDYEDAPADGSAWVQGGDASRRVVRGGSWLNVPQSLRSATRNSSSSDLRVSYLGFRVARTLTP
jgi:formylglycine-generating enzyme required for sulfatase activity